MVVHAKVHAKNLNRMPSYSYICVRPPGRKTCRECEYDNLPVESKVSPLWCSTVKKAFFSKGVAHIEAQHGRR